jgi:hypothetical protein
MKLALILAPTLALALGQPRYIDDSPRPGSFPMVRARSAAPIFVDPADWPGVIRAASDLRADIGRVTSILPDLATAAGSRAIVIGTLGHSPTIDRLAREGKIDDAAIRGKWESYLIQTVGDSLVIAGSDKRGTIFGIYDLSEQIGVSPWYWWADVPVRHRDALYVRAGKYVEGPPAVKYRGIFLNDEAPALSGWVKEKYGTYNSEFYKKVFELILRMKGNYLWPAMWASAFNEDDPLSPRIADEWGIVMGTTHHEPMLRAQQEWKRHGQGPWDYTKNEEVLRKFWEEGVRRNKAYESIISVGMRGDGDMPMARGEANVALLERIVADQRKIIAEQVNPDPTKVPQLWALYKEVQEYYEKGMRVPDDVTLLWSDDNWGDIRRLPTPEERKRSGGAGIYYHFDYVGGPRNYKWIDTNPIPKVWEQMTLAWQYGADRIWIVNVGDLKPMEFPTEFFLHLAWNPARWPKERIGEYTRLWAEREFGPAHAAEIADLVSKTLKYNGRRKPELIDPTTYSLTNYGEADRVVAEYHDVVSRAERISAQLPENARDAFFELVTHPAKAASIVTELYVTAGRNRLYAYEGRPETNVLAAKVKELFQADTDLTNYYNHSLAGGKWNHMMDQTHIGYTWWQEPPKNTMPAVRYIEKPWYVAPPIVSEPHRPCDKPASGFTDDDARFISIEAEHFTSNTGWELIPDYGRTLSAMTTPHRDASADPPTIEYRTYLCTAGKVEVETILSPTLNFVPGRGLRYAISFDNDPPQIIDTLEHNTQRDWETTVKDAVRKVTSTHTISAPGYHTLKVRMVDPALVLEKIVINTGGLKPSYLGPPESTH